MVVAAAAVSASVFVLLQNSRCHCPHHFVPLLVAKGSFVKTPVVRVTIDAIVSRACTHKVVVLLLLLLLLLLLGSYLVLLQNSRCCQLIN